MPMLDEAVALTTRQKVAVILTSLDRSQAAAVLKALPPEQVPGIIAEIRTLGPIGPELRDEVFREFIARLERGPSALGGDGIALGLLQEAVGVERAQELLAPNHASLPDAVLTIPGSDLAPLLKKEQPAVVATILGFLPPEKSADILRHLEPPMRDAVINRLAVQRMPQPAFLRQVETLFMNMIKKLNRSSTDPRLELGGSKYVAEVMQHVDRETEEALFASIAGAAPETAAEIREKMFTFDDITRLSDEDLQRALRSVGLEQLVLALRGVSDAVVEKITRNLSKRAQEALAGEAELLGKVKRKDVEAEQQAFIQVLRELEEAGEISLRPSSDDDGYV